MSGLVELATSETSSIPPRLRSVGMSLPTGKFRVGEYEVEPRTLQVRRQGQSFTLEPKVMGVLVDLAGSAGETRTKREIMDSVWPDVTVGDAVLSRSISILRRTLADDPKNPNYIETIPRIGYRFVANVTRVDNGAAAAPEPEEETDNPFRWQWILAIALATVLLLALGMWLGGR